MTDLLTLAYRAAVDNAVWLVLTAVALLIGCTAIYFDRRSR